MARRLFISQTNIRLLNGGVICDYSFHEWISPLTTGMLDRP